VAQASPGEIVTISVRLTIEDGFHTYAELPPGSAYQPTRLALGSLALGSLAQAEPQGEWESPAAHPSPTEDGVTEYTGEVIFLHRIKILPNATGTIRVPVTVDYQVCDRDSCLRPTQAELEVTVTIKGSY
jgi:DsbC/DsbD-like thiol-disulfide interchange protein